MDILFLCICSIVKFIKDWGILEMVVDIMSFRI